MKPCDICGTPHESWQAHVHAKAVPNDAPNTVSNLSLGYVRTKLWRDGNKERYRESQKLLMRARRERARLAKAEGSGGEG